MLMQVQVLLFGIVADLIGKETLYFSLEKIDTVKNLKKALRTKYPQLKNYNTYAVAVNEHYAQDDIVLKENDIIAIIPPVSGG
jgi:molybdopterin converting factor subunit 1